MENVKDIRTELGGTERKLAEGLGHSREIGRLLGLVELVGVDHFFLRSRECKL